MHPFTRKDVFGDQVSVLILPLLTSHLQVQQRRATLRDAIARLETDGHAVLESSRLANPFHVHFAAYPARCPVQRIAIGNVWRSMDDPISAPLQ
jgi:hypothetical protein